MCLFRLVAFVNCDWQTSQVNLIFLIFVRSLDRERIPWIAICCLRLSIWWNVFMQKSQLISEFECVRSLCRFRHHILRNIFLQSKQCRFFGLALFFWIDGDDVAGIENVSATLDIWTRQLFWFSWVFYCCFGHLEHHRITAFLSVWLGCFGWCFGCLDHRRNTVSVLFPLSFSWWCLDCFGQLGHRQWTVRLLRWAVFFGVPSTLNFITFFVLFNNSVRCDAIRIGIFWFVAVDNGHHLFNWFIDIAVLNRNLQKRIYRRIQFIICESKIGFILYEYKHMLAFVCTCFFLRTVYFWLHSIRYWLNGVGS